MFSYQFKKKTKKDKDKEDLNKEIIGSLKITNKRYNLTMQDIYENLENYFKTYDKIVDNKIYSKLIPLVFIQIFNKI